MKSCIQLILIMLQITVTALAGSAQEPVMLKTDTNAGRDTITLRNYRVSLVITPARGGAVTSYSDRLAPAELILQKEFSGLCLDHFQGGGWPGEFLEAPYESKIVKQSPDEAQVIVWRKAKNGILLEKTYSLRADSPALTCTVKLTAPPDESRSVAYWLQNICYAGGSYDEASDRLYRPSARGVRSTGKSGNGQYGTEDWLRDFTEGWMALVDTKKKSGLALLTDYNDLSVSYACGGNTTFEPMYNTIYLPKGQSRSYTVQIVPVIGLTKVLKVDPQMVAGYTISTDNKGNGTLQFSVCRAISAPRAVAFDVTLVGVQDKKETKVGSVTFDALTDTPQTQTLKFTGGPHDPVVVRVTATQRTQDDKHLTTHFEDFYPGAYQWAENITTDMRTPLYVAERPEQKLILAKPSILKVKRDYNPRFAFFYGLFDEEYLVSDVLHMFSYVLPPIDVSYYAYNPSFYGSVTSFPYDYDKLLNYDCIILGGVSKSGLKPIGIEMLHDYLMAGGSMVVLGSYGSYGRSQLKGTKLADAFPVDFSTERFDLQATGGKQLTTGPDTMPFMKGLAPTDNATCYWLHPATPKPGAKVVLQVDGKPFMVAGEYGPNKGRIICILGAPMGDPTKGQIPFWKDEMWPLILKNAIDWASPWPGIRGFDK
ncbi:MAG: glutamine amidotransferase [Armatimonadota bacterium]